MSRGYESKLGPVGFTFLMFSMTACLPLFFLGPIAYNLGLSLEQALIIAFLGNLVTGIGIVLNGVQGVRRGLDFPAHVRLVYGRYYPIPLVLRGFVGALWFGVEAFNGALALTMILLIALGYRGDLLSTSFKLLPLTLVFYVASLAIALRMGLSVVGRIASLSGILLLAYLTALMVWLSGMKTPIVSEPRGVGWLSWELLVYLAIQTNWWATVAVNASDLTRLARDYYSVMVGVLLGMIGGQILGTYVSYKLLVLTNTVLPQDIIARYSPGLIITLLGLLFAFLAPWTTDLTANMPAFIGVLTGLLRMEWRRAATIASLAGFILAPWYLMDKATGIVDYVTVFASSYGVLLGPVLGVMVSWQLLGNPRVKPWIALTSTLVGIIVSYASSIVTGGVTWVSLIPLPTGISWYSGLLSSMATCIILASTRRK